MFWVRASSADSFEQDYWAIAEAVGISGLDQRADILKPVSDWLSYESNGRWVMILDNADDPNVLFRKIYGPTKSRSLSSFIPDKGSLFITSRNRAVARKLTERGPDILHVEPMSQDDALTLLGTRPNVEGDRDAAKLVKALGYVPLAITQAAKHINKRAPRMSISQYSETVSKDPKQFISWLMKDYADVRRDVAKSNSIIVTLWETFELISKERSSAVTLLLIMSTHGVVKDSVVLELYGAATMEDVGETLEDAMEEDITLLRDHSLITIASDGVTLHMTEMVRVSIRVWLEKREKNEKRKKNKKRKGKEM